MLNPIERLTRIATSSKLLPVAIVPALAPVAAAVIHAQPTAPPGCAMRLSAEVTPDVPNPGDGGILSSLRCNHTEYQLLCCGLWTARMSIYNFKGLDPTSVVGR